MKKLILLLLCLCPLLCSAVTYSIRDFGARGDGKALDSKAINKAIAKAESQGGGTVVVPAGVYLCGSIRLDNNIELRLEPGARIVASADKSAYDKSETFDGPQYQDGGHTFFHNSLIWADGKVHVAITGRGIIDGSALTKKDTEKGGVLQGGSIGQPDKAIALKNCKDIAIEDITIVRGGHFAIIITGCERGHIDNVTIDTNRDGIDIDCCRFISVKGCTINTPNDDALVLKSSYALQKPVPTENITIVGCTVTGYKLGTLLSGEKIPEKVNWVCGRIKLGTESNGGYRNIAITGCTMEYSSGLAFEEVDQGRMENITVSNIAMNHVHHYPIYITTGCRNRGPKERTDVSYGGNISISNVTALDCDSLAGIIVTGMPKHPLHNISLSNISIEYKGGGGSWPANKSYREQGTNYPEPRWAGPTPAYGLFARHVNGLRLYNISFSLKKADARQAVVLEDVSNVVADSQTQQAITVQQQQ